MLVAAHYGAVGGYEHYAGYTRYTVDIGGNLLGIEYNGPGNIEVLDSFLGICHLIPYCYAEYVEFVGICGEKFLDTGNLAAARAAPACPEVNEKILAILAYVVAQFLAVDVEVGVLCAYAVAALRRFISISCDTRCDFCSEGTLATYASNSSGAIP